MCMLKSILFVNFQISNPEDIEEEHIQTSTQENVASRSKESYFHDISPVGSSGTRRHLSKEVTVNKSVDISELLQSKAN